MAKPQRKSPLRAMFLLTSMPIGGAETLLVNLVRRLDRGRIEPMIGCLKEKGELGEVLAGEVPVFDQLISHKYDFAVAGRLKSLMRDNSVDALITVGAGDKMFWGRIAARRAKVPVILSALHSTGWPDGVGKLNRALTCITDGFIACAQQHASYQVESEKFPVEKVFLIPNGIDTDHFEFNEAARQQWRAKYQIAADAPTVGIVAALRSEKNHALFLESAARVLKKIHNAQFVIAGDGPERPMLEARAAKLGIATHVKFLGSTRDVVGVLSMIDLFALTSHNEASPVSIMEALSCQRPVVATDVGSINESVSEGVSGFLVPAGNAAAMSERWTKLLSNPQLRASFGAAGRAHIVAHSSLDSMTEGYMALIEKIYQEKLSKTPREWSSGWLNRASRAKVSS